MKSNLFLRVISVLLFIFGFISVAAAEVTPTAAKDWAQNNGRLLLNTFMEPDIQKRYADLDVLLLKYVDLEYIGKFVVGKYWRVMTPTQQTEYQKIFKRYALALYKTFPLDFANNLSYEVGDSLVDGKFTTVSAKVHVDLGNNTPQDFLLQFRLHQSGAEIKLVDIKLAESSLILSYRSKFYQMISEADGEMEWFLEDLAALAKSAESRNQALSANTNM